MRLGTLLISSALVFAVGVRPAMAQYKEMSKVEALAKNNNEDQLLAALSKHLGVPAATLKQEMSSNNLNFGQLYLAHAIAKAANTSVASVVSDSKTKLWPAIAEERKVDLKQLASDESELERTFKSLKNGK